MSNALQPIFDDIWAAGEVFFRWLFDGWIKEKKDFSPLWTETKLYDSTKNTPALVKENNTDKTQTYIFSIPTGLTIKDFMARKEALAQFLKQDPRNIKIELINNLATVTIYDTSKLDFDYRSYNFNYKGREIKIPIGVSLKDFSTVYWNPTSSNEHNLLLSGATGSGKSVALSVIMEYLINRDDVELYIQDVKYVDLTSYENCPQTKIYNEGTNYALETIKGLTSQMNERYSYLKSKGYKNLNECKEKDKPKYIFYIVEELASFDIKENKEYFNELSELMAKGRAAGIICILVTQTPYAEILPGKIKSNINTIIGLKTRTKEASKIISGDYDLLTGLRGKGHAVLSVNGLYIELQIFNIN